ncbi:MAG: phosphotransferase [Thermoanaerobaculia bacterium]
MDGVRARILPWLSSLGIEPRRIEPLRGDVSARRYFRLVGCDAVVAMYLPDSATDVNRFVEASREFAAAGVRVPEIQAADGDRGLLLLEDLGSESLFDTSDRDWSLLEAIYRQAIAITLALGRYRSRVLESLNPPLDARRLERELQGAYKEFLAEPEFCGSPDQLEAIRSALEGVCRGLASEPMVPAHRDFMSRNLMLAAGGAELVVIDHQDVCMAPRFYDAASLLNDSFFPSSSIEGALLDRVLHDDDDWLAYRRCAVQRTLKACSTFIRFARQGRDRHLPLVAPTLARAAEKLERLPEGARLPQVVFERWRDGEQISAGLKRVAKLESL